MTFFMVVAAVVAFVVLLFLLLFFLVCKIRFRFDTDTGVFSLSLKVLFINIKILPQSEKKKRKKVKTKPKADKKHIFEQKKQEAQDSAKEIADEKKTVGEKVKAFKKLFSDICEKIKVLVPGIMGALALDIKKLDLVVGGEDASRAAINYGAVCASVEALYAVGKNCKKLSVSDKVFVCVDYLEPKFRCEFDIVLKVRVFKVLTTLIRAFS